ncbi:unnamed protein product, partial [Meganyctiphanes norvegica]
MKELKDLREKYSQIKPWRASLKFKITEMKIEKQCSKRHLVVRACGYGLTHLVWWIWRTRVNTSLPDEKDQLPLLAAIDNQHWDTVRHMVMYMATNVFIESPSGVVPFTRIPEHIKQELIKVLVLREFNKLDSSHESARSKQERNEIKEIALLVACIYSTGLQENSKWKAVYSYIWSLMYGKIIVDEYCQVIDTEEENPQNINKNNNEKENNESGKEKINVMDEKDIYTWILKVCQKITSKFNNPENERATLPELMICLTELNKSIKVISDNNYTLSQINKNIQLPIVALNDIIKRAMKVASGGTYNFLLHKLTTAASQATDEPLNEILQSLPLHHAAADGKLTNVAYLMLTCKVDPKVLDLNGNTAAHLAYMNGHKLVAKFILKHDQSIANIQNSSGKTPNMIKEAQSHYEDIYEMKMSSTSDEYMEITEQYNAENLITKLMESWLSKTKNMSFKKLVNNCVVDYTKGEAKEVLTLLTDFSQKLGDGIARINDIFKGKLVLVGSAGDRARLYAPDEFDFSWILDLNDVTSKFEELSKQDQIAKRYTHKISVNSETPRVKNLLHKTTLLEEFHACAQIALKEIIPSLDSRLTIILPAIQRIGCGICLSMAWHGKDYPILIIKTDLVPAIKTPRPNNFPHPTLTEKLNLAEHLESAYIVQTFIGEGEYRTATTLFEQQVFLEPSLESQRFVFLIAKLLVSKLKAEKWAPIHLKERLKYFDSRIFKIPVPSGFLLKSAYFYELQNHPNPNDWKANCVVDRLIGMFNSMCKIDENDKSRLEGKKDSLYPSMIKNYFSPTTQPAETGFSAPYLVHFLIQYKEQLILKETCLETTNS